MTCPSAKEGLPFTSGLATPSGAFALPVLLSLRRFRLRAVEAFSPVPDCPAMVTPSSGWA